MFEYHTEVNGRSRDITINGLKYSYESRDPQPNQDRFIYTLPDGKQYTHATAEGCLLMILNHAAEYA